MVEEIVSSVIVGVLAFAGVIITNFASNSKMQSDIKTSQSVTDTKLEELTREVRKHNDFAVKIPVMQEQIRQIQEELKKDD